LLNISINFLIYLIIDKIEINYVKVRNTYIVCVDTYIVIAVKAATRTNRTAADELRLILKALMAHALDLVQDQNLEAVQEAVRVRVRVRIRVRVHIRVRVQLPIRDLHLDHGRVLDLDPSRDPDPEAFRDQEAVPHPGQDQGRLKAGQDRSRVRARAARDQGLTVAREEVDQSQDQDQVRERAVLGRGHRAVQGKAYRRQGLDPKVAHVQARRNASREARVDHDLNRSLSQDLNQDQGAAADRDRDPDRKAVLEAGVQADQHGKLIFFI